MQIGLVGLSYSGKTTLFQTLTQIHLDTTGFAKRDSNQAIVKVPDERLNYLTCLFNPKKKVNATIEIVDISGLKKGDRTSTQFNTQVISKIRTNDALIHIVRGFVDETVPHPDGSIDMLRDIHTINDELLLTDLAFVEVRVEKLEKDMMKTKDKDVIKKELESMLRWKEQLENGDALRNLDFNEDEQHYLKNYQPITAKPMLIALNLSENDVKNAEQIVEDIKSKINGQRISIIPFFAKIEMELNSIDENDKAIFMEEYGIKDAPLDRMIRSCYDLLGLQSFFTVGEDETRAWTIKKGMTAQQAAGTIHTDFYNKFIRAEVVSYNDFVKYGSINGCKDNGCFRLEGKEYICQDGDILNIRHS
jgi:GTP-binding protein YchF